MRTGLLFDLRNPERWLRPWARLYGQMLELCEGADQLGIGGLWFTEHHLFDDGYLPQPLTVAAAVAARTTQARLGTSVLLPALRKPPQLAEEAAVVDILSGGRLELGVGTGYRIPEYELFDVPVRRRFPLTEQAVTQVLRLWADGGVTPRPLQNPPPVWGGFYGPRGAQLAGRLGIGLLHMSRSMFALYRGALIDAGHGVAAARVSALLPIVLADDPEAAWPRIAPHLAHQHDSYKAHEFEGTDRPRAEPVDPELLRRPADGSRPKFFVLTPAQAAAEIRSRADGLPVEHIILWASVAGMPDDIVQRHVELVATDLRKLIA
jgi:alkanesulfonate monooxygenase SsuD/methylene tetrahydromethanopterin reductase-like flavin-dependent oxidoreductase (luciferase family)